MILSELIAALKDELEVYGDMPVKVDYGGRHHTIVDVGPDTTDGGCFDPSCCNSHVDLIAIELRETA